MRRVFSILFFLALFGLSFSHAGAQTFSEISEVSEVSEQTPTMAKDLSAENISVDAPSSVDLKQPALNHIDGRLSLIQKLQPVFKEAGLPEDVAELEDLGKKYKSHREILQTADNPEKIRAVLETVYPDVVSGPDELEGKRMQVELPEQFNLLTYALEDYVSQADTGAVPKTAGSEKWEGLHADMARENEAIQSLPPRERLMQGTEMVRQFVENHQVLFDEMFRPGPGDSPGPEIYSLMVQIGAWAAARPALTGGGKKDLRPTFPLSPRKALVIIVDDWLKTDPNFSAALSQGKIKMEEVTEKVDGVLKKIKEAYFEMSYGRNVWSFEICRIESADVPVPPGPSDDTRLRTAMQLCKAKKFVLSDYYAFVIWPSDPAKTSYANLTITLNKNPICPVWISTHPFSQREFVGSPLLLLGAFNEYTIAHELGHCISLLHAAAYECGNEVYSPECTDSYLQNNAPAQWRDIYDVMGAYKPEVYTNLLYPHFNCIHKEKLDWLQSRPVGVGKHKISALEQPLFPAPKCLVLPVDQNLVAPKAPCDSLYMAYRQPWKPLGVKESLGGLELHCKTADDILGGREKNYWSESKLLDCTPGSLKGQADVLDNFITNQTCHTNLGYDISFKTINDDMGEVTIVPTCKDKDKDGFQNSNDPKGCALKTKPDCDDTNIKINPDAEEVCDGVDNNCDKAVDKVPIVRKNVGKGGNEVVRIFDPQPQQGPGARGAYVSVCSTCEDTDGMNSLVKGTVTVKRFGAVEATCSDECGDIGGRNEDFWVTECLCKDQGLERVADKTFISCGNDRQCKDGTCVERAVCKDADGDGLQSSLGICKLTDKEDCDDNDAGIGECCHDEDLDRYRDPNNPPVTNGLKGPMKCGMVGGGVQSSGNPPDCDDLNLFIHPFAAEVCGNKIDENCNGQADDGCEVKTFCTDRGGKVEFSLVEPNGTRHDYTVTDFCFLGSLFDYFCDKGLLQGKSMACYDCRDPDGYYQVGLGGSLVENGKCWFQWPNIGLCAGYDIGPNSNQPAYCR